MNRNYTLIVGSRFSLSNETDCDVMTDYFPGIWAISTQKQAMKYSQDLLANGDTIGRVTCYENPKYYALCNKFIKELGLNLPLFEEVAPLEQEVVTKSGVPQNLSQLKKYFTPGRKLLIRNFMSDGTVRNERITSVLNVFSNNMTVEKELGNGIKSWVDFGKASEWKFTNESATQYWFMNSKLEKCTEIFYQD